MNNKISIFDQVCGAIGCKCRGSCGGSYSTWGKLLHICSMNFVYMFLALELDLTLPVTGVPLSRWLIQRKLLLGDIHMGHS